MQARYGDVSRFRIGPLPWYLVLDPDIILDLTVTRASEVRKPDLANRFWKPFLGQGLLASEGELWKRQHRLILPGFRRERIETYADSMVALTHRMVDGWVDGETRDLTKDMTDLTCSIVCKTLFDADVGGGEIDAAMMRLTEALIEHVYRPRPRWWPTEANRQKFRAIEDVQRIVLEIIDDRRREGRDHGDLLSQLVFAKDESGSQMSDVQLRDEAMTLFFAGQETTSLALTWLWYLIARTPPVESKLRAEIRETLGERSPSAADLARMPYLAQVVKEGLRARPPIWSFMRSPMADFEAKGVVIPKGALVFICTYVLQNDPRWFDAPEEFRPERFGPEEQASIHKGAYVPFAAGPRVCIGKNFALMEAALILATVLQRAELSLPEGRVVNISTSASLHPEGGMPMVVRTPMRAAA